MGIYGKCATCGEDNIGTERRPNGDSFCANGHKTSMQQLATAIVFDSNKELAARIAELETQLSTLTQAIATRGVVDCTSGVPVVRALTGKLPVTADGVVIGTEGDVWDRYKRLIRFRTAPVLTCYLNGIEGSPLYEIIPEGAYSTKEAFEAVFGTSPEAAEKAGGEK